MADILKSPATPIATPPSDKRGSGGGVYDGISVAGLPKRTSSPGQIPEKVMDDLSPNPSQKGIIKTPADSKSDVAGVQSTNPRKY